MTAWQALFRLSLLSAALLLPAAMAQAQVLVVTPACGMPGSQALITGSGWAEPAPPCDYIFLFDGAEVAPPQPDGLFGPPNAPFTVPASATPGDHTIRVELRLFDNTLLQCRQTKFTVVTMMPDPWTNTASAGSITVAFDPTDICSVTPCDKIVMIQTVRQRGRKADNTLRDLTFAEQGFPGAATLDADVTPAGYTVDYIIGEKDPYYNGDDPADNTQQGVQGNMPRSSIIKDTPRRTDGAYPADINRIVLDFEVAVFCGAGHDRGEFSAFMAWKWERDKGSPTTNGNVAVLFMSLGTSPSPQFSAALGRWATNHSFAIPATGIPATGGDPCN